MLTRIVTRKALPHFRFRGGDTRRLFASITQWDPPEILFSFTKGRWLFNDEEQRAARYLPFNVSALTDIAVKASGAHSCTSFEKMDEDYYKRHFRLRLDTGLELVARLPFPTSGPKHLTTLSEVATTDFVRTELGVPTPTVLTYCAHASTTPVGREFIIYNNNDSASIPGGSTPTKLNAVWWDLGQRQWERTVECIVDAEAEIIDTRFSQIGSLYYKEDVAPHLQARAVYQEGTQATLNAGRFRVGPSLRGGLWNRGLAALDIDRGPWPDLRSYALALSTCGRTALSLHPHPTLAEHLALLADYSTLMPLILPPSKPAAYVLWHPYMDGDTLLIDRPSGELACILNWQSALIGPYFTQVAPCPRLYFRGSPYLESDPITGLSRVKPAVYTSELGEEERRKAEGELEDARRVYAYKVQSEKYNPALTSALARAGPGEGTGLLADSLWAATAEAEGGVQGVPLIRDALINIVDNWPLFFDEDQETPPCPVYYSAETRARHKVEMARIHESRALLWFIEWELGVDPMGFIDVGRFEEVQRSYKEMEMKLLGEHVDPGERVSEEWPVGEGKEPFESVVLPFGTSGWEEISTTCTGFQIRVPSLLTLHTYAVLNKVANTLEPNRFVAGLKSLNSFSARSVRWGFQVALAMLGRLARNVNVLPRGMPNMQNSKRFMSHSIAEERAVRYVPFDVSALKDVAVKAAGARSCTSFEKMGEGLMNRIFCLRLDDGRELIARISFSVAGPAHYTTASEVATMDHVRTELGLPAPRVLTWCSRAESTPVGREFIVYEKISGSTLSARWWELGKEQVGEAILGIVRAEARVAKTRFEQIGSLYYKEDVPAHLRELPLYPEGTPSTTNSERFCVGPSLRRDLWNGGRAALEIDRGPWPDLHSYALALSANERVFLEHTPHPRVDEHLGLLDDYDKLMPAVLPRKVPCILWHPDMHGENILVDDTSGKISGIIDWQSSLVGPFWTQIAPCPLLQFGGSPYVGWDDEVDKPKLNAAYDELEEEDAKLRTNRDRSSALRANMYVKLSKVLNKAMATALEEARGGSDLVAQPLKVITRGVAEGLPVIRGALKDVVDNWIYMAGGEEEGDVAPPCPVEYSQGTRDRHKAELEQLLISAEVTQLIEERVGVHPSSFVDVDKYEKAKEEHEKLKNEIIGVVVPEAREGILRDWPVQEGRDPVSLEICQ